MTTSSANNSVFKGFFEKQKLTGPNFIDWYRKLRIKLNYLEQPLPPAPVAPEGQQVAPEIIVAHTAWIKGSKEIVRLMLMIMRKISTLMLPSPSFILYPRGKIPERTQSVMSVVRQDIGREIVLSI
ncbi:hypothetical protein Tco_1011951 [Tanacetum coccineum]